MTPCKDHELKIKHVLNSFRKHKKKFYPFFEPVNAEEVPQYYEHIRFPIDINAMSDRLRSGYYVHVSYSSLKVNSGGMI